MTCAVPETDLMQYADSELSADRAAALDQHLQACPACVTRIAQAMQMKRSIGSAGLRYQPSPELRARVRRSITPSRRRPLWVPALAFAAMLLIASAVGLRVLTARAVSRQLVAEVVDRHVSALASANPVEVVSTDRHTVKPWFQGKLPFTFTLPELAGSPYVLEGGRLTFLNQSPGAQLIYDLRKHHISVFIFQDRDVHPSAVQASSSSFTAETWSQGGLRYFVVGDVSGDDLKGLVDRLKTAAGPDTP
jgi:anti-sigma factor RsiW